MGESLNRFRQFNDVFKILSKCTDDYLFILDFIEDHYNITERGAEVFNIPCSDFYNASEILSTAIHPEDRDMLANNLKMKGAGFETNTNIVTMITDDETIELPIMEKEDVAFHILDKLLSL